jgi:hypothetical protein
MVTALPDDSKRGSITAEGGPINAELISEEANANDALPTSN